MYKNIKSYLTNTFKPTWVSKLTKYHIYVYNITHTCIILIKQIYNSCLEILVGCRLLKVLADLANRPEMNQRPSTSWSWRISDAALRSSATSSIWTRTRSTPTSLSTRSTRLSTEQFPAGTFRPTSPTMRTAALGRLDAFLRIVNARCILG